MTRESIVVSRPALVVIGATSLVATALLFGALVRLHHTKVEPATDRASPATTSVAGDPALGSVARHVEPLDPGGRHVEPLRAIAEAAVEPHSPAQDEAALPDDASVLARLHELAASDPEQSLRLARAALERSPSGPSAPELDWNVVKSLYNMGRVEEATDEARAMVRNYPDSEFSSDVGRHLLYPQPNP